METSLIKDWFIKKDPTLSSKDMAPRLNKLVNLTKLLDLSLKEAGGGKNEKGDKVREAGVKYSSEKRQIEVKEGLAEIVYLVFADMEETGPIRDSYLYRIWEQSAVILDEKYDEDKQAKADLLKILYDAYKDLDFENLSLEVVNGNKYFYMKDNLQITDDILDLLSQIRPGQEPAFIEDINGELVFS